MGRIRGAFGRFRSWIEAKSILGKFLVAILAVVAYFVASVMAQSLQDTPSNVALVVLGIPTLIVMIGSLYALAVILYSVWTGIRDRTRTAS